MRVTSSFKPAWWLRNPHLQTVYASFIHHSKPPIDHKERFELPDGDFVDLSYAVNGLSDDTPLVILLHGLGGDENSSYVAGLLKAFNRQGFRGLLMHFRGASAEPNRMARAYHSGDTRDLHCVLQALAKREPHTKKAVVGISLGGNVLLKWLGEEGKQNLIHAAVAVSVPLLLKEVADTMNRGSARVYQRYLLSRLRRVFLKKFEKYPDLLPYTQQEINAPRCFWTFDDQVTAPLHGFSHVHAYYREASSRQFLGRIRTSTLVIHAKDDPFMTPAVLPEEDELSSDVTLEVSERGGHVGFISGKLPGVPVYWLLDRIPEFINETFARTIE